MLLVLFSLLGVLNGVEGSLETCTIPMLNRYTPDIFAIESVPEHVNYDERKCLMVGSYLFMALDDFHQNGILTASEVSRAHNAIYDCKSSVCDKQILKKLENPMALAELASLAVAQGKIFEPGYGVFRYLMDPIYWEIMADVPYPVVTQKSFPVQNEAAFNIISEVCGHQKPTLKSAIYPETVNEVFVSILVERYIPYAFDGGLRKALIRETEPETLNYLWKEAANQRDPSYVCIDYDLTRDEERTTTLKIRDIAERLGITCTAEDGGDFDYAGLSDGAPSGPDGSSGGPPGSSASWAAPPSAGSSFSSFAPGPSG